MADHRYLEYYDLECSPFRDVHNRFHQDQSIDAFDFSSIIVWKANRAKSKVAHRVLSQATHMDDKDLDHIVR